MSCYKEAESIIHDRDAINDDAILTFDPDIPGLGRIVSHRTDCSLHTDVNITDNAETIITGKRIRTTKTRKTSKRDRSRKKVMSDEELFAKLEERVVNDETLYSRILRYEASHTFSTPTESHHIHY